MQTAKNLELHSLGTSWGVHDLGHHVHPSREIVLPIRLSDPLHIGEYRLTKMPT